LNIKDATSSTKRLLKRPEGELVWIKNDDYNENDELNKEKPFYKANIIEDDGIMSHLKLATGEECFENKFMQPFSLNNELVMDYSEMADKGIPDMIDIDELNHATILYNLRKRYEKDMIYTYVGPTLLVVNPFKDTEHTYPDK
jgi:myosin heavy subunit